MKRLSACIRSILLLAVFTVSGCTVENRESLERSDGASQTSLSKAALESFLTAIEGEYLPLYTSDGQYSGMSLHLKGNRLSTCNTHMYETLDACLDAGGQTNYAEVKFFDAPAEGACVGGQKVSAMIMGVESTESICVLLDDTTMTPIDASPETRGSAVLKEGYRRDFLLPAGTPVHITTFTTTDGKLSRFFHLFEAQELPPASEEPSYPGPMAPGPSAADGVASAPALPDHSGISSDSSTPASTDLPQCPSGNFHEFIQEFRKPSIQRDFTTARISYSWLDADFSEVSEIRHNSQLTFPIFPFGGEGVSELFVELPSGTDRASVIERGVENGISVTFGFEKRDGCWQLVSISDFST